MKLNLKTPILGLCLTIATACTQQDSFGRFPENRNDPGNKISSLRKEIVRNPDDINALVDIGYQYERTNSWAQAAGAYEEALLLNDRNGDALVGASTAHSALGQYSSALAYADRALSIRKNVDGYITRSIALNGLRDHITARAVLTEALAKNPRDLDVRSNLALTNALLGDVTAYNMQRTVTFAPDADARHHRNFYLVASILGLESEARSDGSSLGVSDGQINSIFAIGRQARSQGMGAFGLAQVY